MVKPSLRREMAKKALVDHALTYGKVAWHSGSVRPATAMKQSSAMKMLKLLTG